MMLWLLLVVVCSVDSQIIDRSEDVTDRVGKENGDKFIEEDMIMSKELYKAFYGLQEGREGILTELTINSTLWPNATVPYFISNIDSNFRNRTLNAMNHWQQFTCLKFVEYNETEIKQKNLKHYLNFTSNAEGRCQSVVGMNNFTNGQEVLLGRDCLEFFTVVHEIGHAIGFLHEQTRSDRDKYQKIFENNIRDKNSTYRTNFHLQSNLLHRFNLPYDFSSVMHYHMHAFTVNGNNTMVPTDEYVRETVNIGREDGLSFYDKKHANLMYKCDDICNPKLDCENEGYVDQSCECQCLEGYGGKLCEIRKTMPAPICGGNYTTEEDIKSPNYPNPSPPRAKCIWKFTAPAGRLVQIQFLVFDLHERSNKGQKCEWDTLDIRGPGYNGERTYCGKELQGQNHTTTASQNDTYIMFKADTSRGTTKGFLARVSFV